MCREGGREGGGSGWGGGGGGRQGGESASETEPPTWVKLSASTTAVRVSLASPAASEPPLRGGAIAMRGSLATGAVQVRAWITELVIRGSSSLCYGL